MVPPISCPGAAVGYDDGRGWSPMVIWVTPTAVTIPSPGWPTPTRRKAPLFGSMLSGGAIVTHRAQMHPVRRAARRGHADAAVPPLPVPPRGRVPRARLRSTAGRMAGPGHAAADARSRRGRVLGGRRYPMRAPELSGPGSGSRQPVRQAGVRKSHRLLQGPGHRRDDVRRQGARGRRDSRGLVGQLPGPRRRRTLPGPV